MTHGPIIRELVKLLEIGEHAVDGRQSGQLQTPKLSGNFHRIHTCLLTKLSSTYR